MTIDYSDTSRIKISLGRNADTHPGEWPPEKLQEFLDEGMYIGVTGYGFADYRRDFVVDDATALHLVLSYADETQEANGYRSLTGARISLPWHHIREIHIY